MKQNLDARYQQCKFPSIDLRPSASAKTDDIIEPSMPPSTPSLSIIIPVYNRAEYLSSCVESAKNQSYRNIEILLVDDYSNEETKTFLHLFSIGDSRIRVIPNQGKKGANACRNLGLRESRGKYVMFLDSDDILCPFCAKMRIEDFEAAPELDFIAYPCLMFQNKPLDRLIIWNIKNETNLLDRFLQHDAPFQTSGPLWRRSSILGAVEWDEDLPGWQDWKFHIEALLRGLKGELRTRIDYFWNAPKESSITRSSHNYAGRLQRMQAVVKLANSAAGPHRAAILSSVISLAIRMSRKGRLGAALAVRHVLKGNPKATAAAAFVLLEHCKSGPLVYFRGFFRKQVFAHYPLTRTILQDSKTYKLSASTPQLQELISLLNENCSHP
jgi:hypothetical protein